MTKKATGQGASDESPAIEAPAEVIGEPHTPTREEAREMFKANPGLWSVLTDEGNVTRDAA